MIKPLLLAATALILAAAPATAQTRPAPAPQGLSQPGSSFAEQDNPGNWGAATVRTERGHTIGNPEAETKLIEFISYTCPHCADFTARGEAPLEIVLLQPGKMTLEVRSFIRNGVDVAATLLAQCGDPAGFKERHKALMLNQATWLAKARGAPVSQQQLWQRGDKAGRINAANALGLTALLAARGQSLAELDACLADDAAAARLRANTDADAADFGVTGTPSFALDDKLLDGVHGWDALYPVLSARFAAGPAAPVQGSR